MKRIKTGSFLGGGQRKPKLNLKSKSKTKPNSQPKPNQKVHPRRKASPSSLDSIASPSLRWIIGLHSVEEALRVHSTSVGELWVREGAEDSSSLSRIIEMARQINVRVVIQPVRHLDLFGSGHQGVAMSLSSAPQLDWQQLQNTSKKHRLLIALDGIVDPQNLGSILRTTWLMGGEGVFVPADRAVGLTPTVGKIASGGCEHVPVESVSNLVATLKKLKDIGFWVFGLDQGGERAPWNYNLPEKIVWVLGSEAQGMRLPTKRVCDECVSIPQVSQGASYNASISLAMALAETSRQWGHIKSE